MKELRLSHIILFFAMFIGAFLFFSFGSPALSGKATSPTDPIFSVRIIDFQSPVDLGGFLEFSYATRSILGVNGTADATFWIEKGGRIISSGTDTIFLGNLEERTRTANIFIPSDFESGVYDLNIEVDYQGFMERAHRTIEINVKGGFATISAGFGKANIAIVSLLAILALLNIFIVYHYEKKKIKHLLEEEGHFLKRHRAPILVFTFFVILVILIYWLDRVNLLPGIPIYYWYLILGVLFVISLFLARHKHRG